MSEHREDPDAPPWPGYTGRCECGCGRNWLDGELEDPLIVKLTGEVRALGRVLSWSRAERRAHRIRESRARLSRDLERYETLLRMRRLHLDGEGEQALELARAYDERYAGESVVQAPAA